ncbi:UNVERIFIED_CONTAM: hypothetical protein Sradi_1773100 [Sesamum radiatum]|uniref:Retrotransposon gag domain-containing protein n=1 Tax=Sesamum radiatum TaxID=300843 RepID=A0AAW2TV10_SESRA
MRSDGAGESAKAQLFCAQCCGLAIFVVGTREACYGECEGPLLYKIQWEISTMTQGNLNVTTYYTSMKQLWDELVCFMPPAMCTCGSNKTKLEQMEASQLIQFLIGQNESFDNIRNQILVLDPLPHVNIAYSMVLRVKRQRQVNLEFAVQLRTLQ